MRDTVARWLGWSFAALGMMVLLSGSLVFFMFALGMAAGGATGVRLAIRAERIMGVSLWLAVLTTLTGMLQMYAARESALQMDRAKERLGEKYRKADLRTKSEGEL
jgi:hypothetical protein